MGIKFRQFIENDVAAIKMKFARNHLEKGDIAMAMDVLTPAPKRSDPGGSDDPESVLHEPRKKSDSTVSVKDYMAALEYLKSLRAKDTKVDLDPGDTMDYKLPDDVKAALKSPTPPIPALSGLGTFMQPVSASKRPT